MNAVNTLKNNAYHVLGLDTEVDQRKIQQRANEIRNRLKIDDLPEYDLDLGVFEDFRTEDAVREAIQKLGAPRGRIKEYFFWFQVTDDVDKQALKLLKDKDYASSAQVWEDAIKNKGERAYFYKKNLAILYCLLLSVEDSKEARGGSLALWKELVESAEFWKVFSQRYMLHNEQTANEELIGEFRKQVTSYLSDMYTELYLVYRNPSYISRFLKTFPVTGESMVRDVLEPALIAINDAVEELGKTDVNEETEENEIIEYAETIEDELNRLDDPGPHDDGRTKVLGDKATTARKKFIEYVSTIQNKLDQLKDFGLYDDSRTKVLRDKAATKIRSIGIDFYNKLYETERSMFLMQVALKIVGTSGLKAKIQDDIKTLGEIKEKDDLVRSVQKYSKPAPSAQAENSLLIRFSKSGFGGKLMWLMKGVLTLIFSIIIVLFVSAIGGVLFAFLSLLFR